MRYRAWFFLILLVAMGCGLAERGKHTSRSPAASAPAEATLADGAASQQPQKQAQQPASKPGAVQRKIVYTATVELVVERFDDIPTRVESLVSQFGGFVGRSTVSGSPGSPRSGHWSIRVPVENYAKLLAAAEQLGEARSVTSNAQDVSEEYYDVEARIRNDKKEEERLLKLLDERTGKLDEVLQVERELSRVRGQIEQSEGRLRVLGDLAALSTVNLQIEEIKGFVPEESPSYAKRVRRAWDGSITALVSRAQSISIALVALAPWLGVILVPIILLWLAARTLRRRHGRSSDSAGEP